MGRPPLCCVFCHTPVQRTEEGCEVLMNYLDFYEGKPVCGDCVDEVLFCSCHPDHWHRVTEEEAG